MFWPPQRAHAHKHRDWPGVVQGKLGLVTSCTPPLPPYSDQIILASSQTWNRESTRSKEHIHLGKVALSAPWAPHRYDPGLRSGMQQTPALREKNGIVVR